MCGSQNCRIAIRGLQHKARHPAQGPDKELQRQKRPGPANAAGSKPHPGIERPGLQCYIVRMRVVGGSAKGRKLKSVPGDSTRPVTDRVKTALFDILRPFLPGIKVLDLFAGSGAVGIEALSQGAARCTFIDLERRAIETIRENLTCTGLAEQAEVKLADAFRFLKNCREAFDLIYIAPPQYKNLWVEALQCIAERPHLLSADGRVVVQIDPLEADELKLSELSEVDRRRYGNSLLLIFCRR